jgi:hypothetical protein
VEKCITRHTVIANPAELVYTVNGIFYYRSRGECALAMLTRGAICAVTRWSESPSPPLPLQRVSKEDVYVEAKNQRQKCQELGGKNFL